MNGFEDITVLRSWAEMWIAAFGDNLRSAAFLIQLTLLVGTALSAMLAARFLQRLAARLLAAVLARPLVAVFSNVVASVAVPALWLFLLWVAADTARNLGFPAGLLSAGVSLLTAWVVLRLFSHVVRNELWSRVIFFAVFSLAALDILGLLGQIRASLAGIGFEYGTIRITALNFVHALVVLAILLWLSALLRAFLERRIARARGLTPSLQALVIQILKLLLPTLAVLAALPVLGVSLTALTVFGGALAIGVGLGMQRVISNLISGLMLLGSGTLKPGDVIATTDVGGKDVYGRVYAISSRHVSLRTRNGTEHLIPNDHFLTNGVENWSHSDNKVRLKIPFGVAYESDPHQVIGLALEGAAAVKRVLDEPAPVCLLTGYGDSSVDFELRVWIDDPMNGMTNVKSQCLLEMWDRFHAHGIAIPFPQRDVHIRTLPEGATFKG